MKHLLSLLLLFTHFISDAQNITLQVTDLESKQPVEFASILLPAYKQSFVTDERGILQLDTGIYKLPLQVTVEQFSFESKKLTIQNATKLYNVLLNPTSELLQEIIIPPANAKIKERTYGRKGEGSGKIVGVFRNYDYDNKSSGVEFGMILNTGNKLKKLKKVHWHIKEATFSSAVFGLQFYEMENGKPGKRIPHPEINFSVKNGQTGWLVLNLEDMDIYFDKTSKIAAVLKTQKITFDKDKEGGSLALNVGFAAGNVLVGRDSQFEEWVKFPMNYPFYITVDSYE